MLDNRSVDDRHQTWTGSLFLMVSPQTNKSFSGNTTASQLHTKICGPPRDLFVGGETTDENVV